MENERLVWFVINRFFKKYRNDDDVIQAARIGLWRAQEGFDETSNTAFSTYAVASIRNNIIIELRFRSRKEPQIDAQNTALDSTLLAEEFTNSLSARDASIVRDLMRGYKQCEIAQKNGVTGSAINRRIKKIQRKAKKYFEKD